MKVSALQLAGLPGMPAHERSVRRLASKRAWPCSVNSRGVTVYPSDLLPTETLAALVTPDVPSETEIEGRTLGSELVGDWRKAKAKACEKAILRARIVTTAERLHENGLRYRDVYPKVEKLFGVPERSVRRWCKLVVGAPIEDWAVLLLPKYRPTVQPKPVNDDAWNWFLSDYLRLSKPGLAACHRRLLEAAKHRPEWGEVPSEQSLRRRLQREVDPTTLMLRREGGEFFDHRIPAQQRDKTGMHALEHVNADGHRFDVFVRFPNLNPDKPPIIRRPVLMAWQDLYSNKFLSWRLDETENGDVVRLAFADMVRDFGIPYKSTVDNGHAFADKRMTGGLLNRNRYKFLEEEPDGIYKSFNVEAHFTKPYHGQSKPIERGFRDLCEEIAKHPLCQGAYTGNRPNAKPEDHNTHAVDYHDFVALVEERIAEYNARQGRRTGVARGGSFDDAFFASYNAESTVIRRATEAQIQWLLLPIEGCLVGRDEAVITLMGNRFWHTALLEHRGEKMVVRFDPADIQAGIYVFENGAREPLCHAQCIARTGFSDTDAARRDARARKAVKNAAKKAAEALGTIPAHQLNPKVKPAEKRKRSGKVIKAEFGAPPVPTKANDKARELAESEEMFLKLGRAALRKLEEEKKQGRNLRAL